MRWPRRPRWRYRREPLVLGLAALASLSLVHAVTAQDVSRLGLTRSISLYRSLELDAAEAQQSDKALYHGRYYTDKAPGMSFLALPPYEVARVVAAGRAPEQWNERGDLQLWYLRLATSGVAFVLCLVLVGRVAEELVAGTGAATAATFGLGTLASPLAATTFGHVTAAALGFAAFVAAWRGRAALAGLCAGFAVLVEYQVALVALVVLLYLARSGMRPLARYVVGAIPGVAILALYDALAFGSPFHLSYSYVANRFASEQRHGFFGIGTPHGHALAEILFGYKGLLVFSPVLVAAATGLAGLWRRRRAEALVCVAVTLLFLLWTSGYFLPYGGRSPGPRFVVPALPFLALGLPYAFRRAPLPTLLLALASVVLTTLDALTWSYRPDEDHSYTGFWTSDVVRAAWVWVTGGRLASGIAIVGVAAAALAVAATPLLRRRSVKSA